MGELVKLFSGEAVQSVAKAGNIVEAVERSNVIGDDVQHEKHAVFFQRLRELFEVLGRSEVLVDLVKVLRPITVIACNAALELKS